MQGGSNKGLDVDVGNFFNQGLEEGIKIQAELANVQEKEAKTVDDSLGFGKDSNLTYFKSGVGRG